MNKITHATAAASLLLLCSCAAPAIQSVHDKFVGIEAAAASAKTLALAYVSLPLCPAQPVCANPPVVVKINSANTALNLVITQTRALFADLSTSPSTLDQAVAYAQTALSTLTTLNSDPAVIAALKGTTK